MKKYSHYTWEQIQESGLFSEDRLKEIGDAIEARIKPIYLDGTRKIGDARFLDAGDGTGFIHSDMTKDHQWEYIRRSAVPLVLTEAELDTVNKLCMDAMHTRREKEQFEKAEKLTAWDEGVFHGDTYHASIFDALDAIECDGEDKPEYFWAADPRQVISGFDVAEVVQNQLEENGWEDMDTHDLNGVDDLQTALDAFTEANKGVTSYFPDYSKVILVSDEKRKASAQTGSQAP